MYLSLSFILIPLLFIDGAANNISSSFEEWSGGGGGTADRAAAGAGRGGAGGSDVGGGGGGILSDRSVVEMVPYQVEVELNNNYSLNSSHLLGLSTLPPTRRRHGHRRRRPSGPPSSPFLENLDQIVMPVALCIGIIGNILLFPVFTLTPLRANSLSHYLAAMSVSDVMYLVSCLIVWTTGRGVQLYHTIGVCQITSFILRLSQFLATWYLLAAHVERFLVHFGSFRAIAWCSTFRTKFIILFIFVFSLVGFLHYIWTHIVSERNGGDTCMIMHESLRHIFELGKIEVFAALFIPMLFIILIDIALCINTIVKRYRLYFRVTTKNGPVKNEMGQDDLGEYVLAPRHRSGSTSNRSRDSSPPSPEFDLSLERKSATISVVISGLIFIGLILPSSIYRARLYFGQKRGFTREDRITMALFEQLVKFNSVYKFLLYLIFLRTFRTGLVYLVKCKGKRNPSENSLQETTEV